ncbi:MAG TPA: TonB-dependent receptor, partial [Phnomibacter sp.]|nr:TonB-dependent receptor [Phnomibacter sp.]
GESNFYSSEVFADLLLSGHNNITRDLGISYNLGGILQRTKSKFNDDYANGLLIPNKFNLAFARALQNSNSLFEKELQGAYATAQINYKDWLNIDITGRNDWSSTLPAPHSYFYPSVGANVILSDALSLKNNWLSFLKVRGSYTQVGNDAQPYLLQQTYSFTQGGRGGFIERDGTKLIPDLKPELTTSLEFGLESRFFNNRLGVDLTWYKSNTKNQLLRLALPPATGFGDQYINAGNIQNSGLEVQAFFKAVAKRNFGWDINLNFARNRNKVVALSEDIKSANLSTSFIRTAGVVVNEGGAYGDLYGFKWQRDAKGAFVMDAQGRPAGTPAAEYLGNFNPNWTLGVTNSFNVGQWNMSVLVDGRVGGIMVSGTDGILAYDGNVDYTTQFRNGGWVLPGVNQQGGNNTVAINAEQFWQQVSQGRYMWGEFFAYDATNFRVRELTFGRQFALGKAIKSMKISLVARNLFFLYRGKTILDIPGLGKRSMRFDPDINLGAGNYQGIEYGNMPSTRSIGLNLKFDF